MGNCEKNYSNASIDSESNTEKIKIINETEDGEDSDIFFDYQ